MQASAHGAAEQHRDREAVEKCINDNWYTTGTDGIPASSLVDQVIVPSIVFV